MSDNFVMRMVELYDGLFALDEKDECDLYLDLGRQFLADGRPTEALQLFRKATVIQPDAPAAWVEMGRHYLIRKAPKAALTALNKALDLGVESAEVHRCLAEALVLQDRFEEAEDELEIGLELDPESPECWFDVGLLRDARGDFDLAVEAFTKAADLEPDKVSHHQRLGFALESAGRRSEAIVSFKAALKLESAAGR
ncbi:MAG: hypothetical protein DRJ42_28885 [Deltaproteobacteria bacterium]|nr:MAG: hypothetical protein DRJ42_28885 [Deltaproteobacteria bacterium]